MIKKIKDLLEYYQKVFTENEKYFNEGGKLDKFIYPDNLTDDEQFKKIKHDLETVFHLKLKQNEKSRLRKIFDKVNNSKLGRILNKITKKHVDAAIKAAVVMTIFLNMDYIRNNPELSGYVHAFVLSSIVMRKIDMV